MLSALPWTLAASWAAVCAASAVKEARASAGAATPLFRRALGSPPAAGLHLAPQWRADFRQDLVVGTWRYDAIAGKSDLLILMDDSSHIKAGMKTHMRLSCRFNASSDSTDGDFCVSSFRSTCAEGPIHTRTETIWRLFRALPRAVLNATATVPVDSEPCPIWTVSLPGIGQIWVCLDESGVPRYLRNTADASFVGPSNVEVSEANFTFYNASVGPQDIGEVQCPEDANASTCPLVCPGHGVVSLQVLRGSWGEPWGDLSDRDTGDIPGDIISFLRPGDDGAPPARTYIMLFNATANSSWAPWRDCNHVPGEVGNECSPAVDPSVAKLVGRASAEQYEGPCSGQCGANELAGSWYTFPKEGECRGGAAIGTDGCAWRLEFDKVVRTDCVFSTGEVLAAWQQDYGHAPWPNMQAALMRHIYACPDVRDSEAGSA